MAAVKKYAGLPDVDEGVEIFESTIPDLTEASTLPTESTDESDEDNPNFDRGGLNADAARQRFEPSIVDARNANFSDTIDGGRQAYQIRSKRRRRRAARTSGSYSDDSEEETLPVRLARLKREAAELQAEIDKAEEGKDRQHDTDGDSDYEDTVDHLTHHDDLARGVEELTSTLEGISVSSRRKGRTLEEEFTQGLDRDPTKTRHGKAALSNETLSKSSISAIAAFSDRLTALETTLGLSTTSTGTTSSIVPTLDTLSTQIETLYSTLAPKSDPTNNSTTTTTSTAHLDAIAQKIRYLITESKRLEDSRRAATKSFEELLETRDRHAHLIQHTHAQHPTTEARLTRNGSSQDVNVSKDDMQNQFTSLFLDDQARRISALYMLLPTIQSLQPLLPVVLERLRALSVIHTGAAEVRGELDDIERRLEGQEQDVKKWREALERAEAAMQEGKDAMKDNVQVVGDMVRGLEGRVKALNTR